MNKPKPIMNQPTPEIPKSPIDLWKLMGGKAKPVGGVTRPPQDGLLAVYKDRLTYTFILSDEVASIHFDRVKGEIFFKGHNIRNLELLEEQKRVLEDFKVVLAGEERCQDFLNAYQATLGNLLADNK